jgi:TusA-related sulfurtransferase
MINAKTRELFLDITQDRCPMTFVRAKLMAEGMAPGDSAVLRLSSGEPLENLPRSLVDHGFRILSLTLEDPSAPDGPWRLTFQAP